MNKEEYFKYHADCCARMVEITKAKNADYTGVGDNPFANFTRVEVLGNCSTEQGFVTRMIDKLSRIISFVQKGILEVKDESVEDTLLDLANYCILFSGYIKHKKDQSKVEWTYNQENLPLDVGKSAAEDNLFSYQRMNIFFPENPYGPKK